MILRRRDAGPSRAVRGLVQRRSGGRCEWPGCIHAATDMHHRLNRKMGGRRGEMAQRVNGAAWLLHCCRRHHQAVTSAYGPQLARARDMGWLLTEGQDASTVPVWTTHRYGPLLLCDGGGFTDMGQGQ